MGCAETYQYDQEGDLSLHIDRDGRRLQRDCNVFGQPVYEKATDAEGKNPTISTWHYDSLGRVTRAVCDGHSYEYLYGEKGNLKEKCSSGRRLISYAYDRAGQITEIKDPAGVCTKYEYDVLGRRSRIYNDEGLEVRYGYDALDRISRIRYGNGVETAYAYDGDGNISSLETRAGENILLSFAYQYDGNGNRTAKAGTQARAALSGISSEITEGNNTLDISYSYDIRGQLLEERRNGGSVSYAYDKAGNRIRKTDAKGATLYRFNGKNQLIETENNNSKNQFTYDRQGGIVEEKNVAGIRLFSYNSRHQQTKVETENGNVQENLYDVANLRFELLENGKRTGFVYHNGELLHEEGGDESQTSYHLGAGIDALQRGQELSYYHRDEQLSTVFITDGFGEIKNSYLYDAFGAELETNEQFSNRIRYTGQQYDELTEQYYLRARYYNPVLGRFMQEDVYQGDGLNLYAYCENNPVVYYDSSGYTTQAAQPTCPPTSNVANGNEENKYPERTPDAQAEAQKVIDARNEIVASGESTVSARAAAVFTHEDGTVSVGVSGSPNGRGGLVDFAETLQDTLNEDAGYDKYTVSGIVDKELYSQIEVPPQGGGCPRGVCAEPKAATAAHYNDSPITGMDVRYFDETSNPYPLINANSPNQMEFCNTCKSNEEVIMNYANNNQQ